MKKIMFNDKYGLTDAVLRGDKTMTRRIVPNKLLIDARRYSGGDIARRNQRLLAHASYKVGEVVAVAQRYSELSWDKAFYDTLCSMCDRKNYELPQYKFAGWDNKMFVKADLMPHRIIIDDVKLERLQDISDEDCLCEGILHSDKYAMPYGITEVTAPNGVFFYYSSPREAFAALIDKVSGKGTWQRNPWVWVYLFELLK